jgi:uncharacterized protein (DUF1810 family)
MLSVNDAFNLARFVRAQDSVYAQALAELRRGRKTSHWMWFIFPQVAGLGMSEMSRTYGIASLDEARAYLNHDVLGPRLRECTQAVLEHEQKTAEDIFGGIDAMKFRSCLTLFVNVSASSDVFSRALERFFQGRPDEKTRALLTPPERPPQTGRRS